MRKINHREAAHGEVSSCTYLTSFQIWVIHIRVFRIWTSRIRLVLTRLARVRGMGRLVDDILHIHDLALVVTEPIADDVPGPFQLF